MSRKYIIAIDLGATNIKIGLVSQDRIVLKKILATRDFHSQAGLISGLCYGIQDILSVKGITKKEVLGIGVGLPGPVDSLKGVVRFFPNIKGWHNVPFREIIRRKMGLPVGIDNDANLMCLAEARLGAARGRKNVVALTLGTGVGAGVIVEGRLYRGSSLSAGEIGHMPLNEEGPLCNCGGRACLERYIGNKYILEEARTAFGKAITLEELSRLSDRGNKKARHIWISCASRLGIALSSVVNFFNPDTIVIGGGLANAGKIIFDTVRQKVRERAMPDSSRAVKIVKARMGNDAGMMGAALLVKEEYADKS